MVSLQGSIQKSSMSIRTIVRVSVAIDWTITTSPKYPGMAEGGEAALPKSIYTTKRLQPL